MAMQYSKQQQMSSKPYKIFGPHTARGGIEAVSGRNAQFSTMAKKPDYIEGSASDRNYLSPFGGYTASSETNLSLSQASEFNPDLSRKLIREELERQLKDDASRNDVGILKAEMRGMKQFVQSFRGEFERAREERESFRDEIRQQMDAYREQTARNLKEVIKMLGDNVRKEVIVQLGNEYLSKNFVDDMEKQFNELEDRIQIAEGKLSGADHKPFGDPVVLAETLELRMKKIERETEFLKRSLSESQSQISEIESNATSARVKQENLDEKIAYLNEDLLKLKQELEKETKRLSQTLDEKNKNLTVCLEDKIKDLTDQLSKHSSGSNQVRQFLDSEHNLAVSGMFELSKSESKESADNNQVAKPLFRSPPRANSSSEAEMKGSVTYLIDKENSLMDEDGCYITNAEGNPIKLNEEQVEILRKSNVVKMVEG